MDISAVNSLEEDRDHKDVYEKDDHETAVKRTQTANHDGVFGEITEEGPNYRNVPMSCSSPGSCMSN
jgi:hypothetical protein